MSIRLNVASGIAVAATLLTALVSAGGSDAQAEAATPVIVPETIATQLPATGVGALAKVAIAPIASLPDLPVLPLPSPRAETLAAHVKAQVQPGPLDQQMRCLAGAIYFEARGESLDGQLAVGRVVVERASSGRFSFVHGQSMPAIPEASSAWQRAVAIARIAHENTWQSPADGALYFHATHVSPGWRKQRLARIDNHIFYR